MIIKKLCLFWSKWAEWFLNWGKCHSKKCFLLQILCRVKADSRFTVDTQRWEIAMTTTPLFLLRPKYGFVSMAISCCRLFLLIFLPRGYQPWENVRISDGTQSHVHKCQFYQMLWNVYNRFVHELRSFVFA